MSRWSGSREQRQAAVTKATKPAGSPTPHDVALRRYLELEARQPKAGQVAAASSHPTPSTPRAGLRHGQRSTGVTHQHVVINGRAVEVSEDAIGVAELHLE